ncbi:hypothetical protein V6N13_089015 [Hibiscus sabdariffa]|uniref:Uncharacterized protein n=1 Tax=Hibiscus sabdariffa TaxID=183260 RepID=A0ABR2G245_9ROSI
MKERLWRRQRRVVKGPSTLALERSRDVTESHETPRQLHGVGSRGFHEERAKSGSEREALTWRRGKGMREEVNICREYIWVQPQWSLELMSKGFERGRWCFAIGWTGNE